jgi:glyoxylase-like metal-dependent hydrolase (beta-lactamase superfamily II)
MRYRWAVAFVCVVLVVLAAWLGGVSRGDKPAAADWVEVLPGVWRSPGLPAGYALLDGASALLIDAPAGTAAARAFPATRIDAVLLTHHHRDTCAAAARYLAGKVPVRAAKESAEWLLPEKVRKYWQESLPLRNSRTAYLVLADGLDGVDYSLADGQHIDWHGWDLQVVATPGHSRDHLAFAARKGKDGPLLVFCGDALAEPGKVWSPYTTDWDHWTDAGLKPAAQSLRKLAELKPATLLPAHGAVIKKDAVAALEQTAKNVEEMGFLKSFERFTKIRLKDAPEYKFLAKEQAESNGSKPWSRVSDHLWLTGNTYVLISKEDNAFLVVDPWDKRSADQVAKLKADQKLGPMEVVMFSHAHFDHYDGIYHLPDRDKFAVWTLDQVATPLAEPGLLRAPFLDARPVRIDKRYQDGDTAAWREYRFRFHHLPGQTEFTMGVETTIDGKRCYFTADNWFHQDQFSGTGGWMGLNRSYPLPYAESARKVLDAAPDWVLAEHGGPFEFNAEDWRRRVEWGKVGARAADALCVSGNHRRDWDPHLVHVEPLIHKARAGATLKATLVAANPLPGAAKLAVLLEGRGLAEDQRWELDVPAGGSARRAVTVRLGDKVPAGRQVLALRVLEGDRVDGCDAFLAVDVGP